LNKPASTTADNSKRRGSGISLLQPAVLARMANLELVAKAVVEGFFTGMHRSPFFGFSQEFAEYRAYNDGDDPRYIDWNVYARTDRTYIKRFIGETNTAINLVLDVSASMDYRSADVSKLQYGRFICAALGYLARKQHDAIGATLFDHRIRDVLPPATHPDTLYRLLAMLERNKAEDGTEIHDSLSHIAGTITRRGLVIMVSDFYCDPDELSRNLQVLVQQGHEVALFHLLDPAERHPATHNRQLQRAATLRDMESGNEIKVTADFLREHYPAKIAAHIAALSRAAVKGGFTHVIAGTDQPLDDLLQQFLLLRQQKL